MTLSITWELTTHLPLQCDDGEGCELHLRPWYPHKQPFVGGWSGETGLTQVSGERTQEGAGQDEVMQRETVSV